MKRTRGLLVCSVGIPHSGGPPVESYSFLQLFIPPRLPILARPETKEWRKIGLLALSPCDSSSKGALGTRLGLIKVVVSRYLCYRCTPVT